MRIGEAQLVSLVLLPIQNDLKVIALSLVHQLLAASLQLIRLDAQILRPSPSRSNDAVVVAKLLQRGAAGAVLDLQRGAGPGVGRLQTVAGAVLLLLLPQVAEAAV